MRGMDPLCTRGRSPVAPADARGEPGGQRRQAEDEHERREKAPHRLPFEQRACSDSLKDMRAVIAAEARC